MRMATPTMTLRSSCEGKQRVTSLMKNWRTILGLAFASFAVNPIAVAAENNTATVSFSGYVTQCICQLADNSTSVDVPMGTVAASSFSGVGARAGQKRFTLRFKNCPPNAKLHIAWSGRRIPLTTSGHGPVMPGLMALDGMGQNKNVAKGVALSLTRADERLWELSEDSPFTTNADGTATVDLVAAYQSIAPVEGGSAGASAFFIINYKQY